MEFVPASVVRTVTRVLTNAEIKALPAASLELVPDAPAGGRNIILWAYAAFEGTTAYTNINASSLFQVRHPSLDYLTYLDQSRATGKVSFLLAAGGSVQAAFTPLVGPDDDPVLAGGVSFNDDSSVILTLDNNAAGNLTGGTAANELIVVVAYCQVS